MKIKSLDAEMIKIWRRKSVLEMPAVIKEMQKFWAKDEFNMQDIKEMRQILRDAANLLNNIEQFLFLNAEKDEESVLNKE